MIQLIMFRRYDESIKPYALFEYDLGKSISTYKIDNAVSKILEDDRWEDYGHWYFVKTEKKLSNYLEM